MKTLTHLYDSYGSARTAMAAVLESGIPEDDISVVSNNVDGSADRDGDGVSDSVEGAATGAGIGAALGGGAGLLAGLGILAIPGIGPVVAAGWLAATAAGVVAGGAAGGLIGGLTQAGVSEADAHTYAEGVRRGGTLLTVRVADDKSAQVEAILARGSIDISRRGEDYRAKGWNRFDAAATGMTAEEIRQERERTLRS